LVASRLRGVLLTVDFFMPPTSENLTLQATLFGVMVTSSQPQSPASHRRSSSSSLRGCSSRRIFRYSHCTACPLF